ncbi:hypothetical protein VB774_23035, partial [Pseudanabaena galeata UHCC 0370]
MATLVALASIFQNFGRNHLRRTDVKLTSVRQKWNAEIGAWRPSPYICVNVGAWSPSPLSNLTPVRQKR